MVDKLKEYLDSKTPKELSKEWDEMFPPDTTPKGWVSIEDSLPMMLAMDIGKGYTEYKVKFKDGHEYVSYVSDHNVWYYEAKDAGITHWFNE